MADGVFSVGLAFAEPVAVESPDPKPATAHRAPRSRSVKPLRALCGGISADGASQRRAGVGSCACASSHTSPPFPSPLLTNSRVKSPPRAARCC
jgi:hypothetical protein